MSELEPEAATYSIVRMGNDRKRHYQIVKMIMGVAVDWYAVQLDGRDKFFCNCPGFQRQRFPKIEHKHIKLAMDFHDRGEPAGAEYRIHGTGAKTVLEIVK